MGHLAFKGLQPPTQAWHILRGIWIVVGPVFQRRTTETSVRELMPGGKKRDECSGTGALWERSIYQNAASTRCSTISIP